jgi:hypothetical protein
MDATENRKRKRKRKEGQIDHTHLLEQGGTIKVPRYGFERKNLDGLLKDRF